MFRGSLGTGNPSPALRSEIITERAALHWPLIGWLIDPRTAVLALGLGAWDGTFFPCWAGLCLMTRDGRVPEHSS